MSSRELMHVIPFAICRLVSLKSWAVPRGDPTLDESNRIAWKINRFRGAAATSQNRDTERGNKKNQTAEPAGLRSA
jgi:hypothetical protein